MLKIYLTEEERTAVMLRYFYDVPYTELAEYFHMSESAARQKVSRAIKKLRKVAPDVWYR
jgi:RNA polymerase sigma factor (sigma-70 family)